MSAAEGRPHWGKIHHLGADDLRPRYPRFDDFLAVRDRLDPGGGSATRTSTASWAHRRRVGLADPSHLPGASTSTNV